MVTMLKGNIHEEGISCSTAETIFRTFVLIRQEARCCLFFFLISYLCPLSYQMLHYTLGPGERRLYGSRLDFPLLFLFFFFRFLLLGFENDILHSNYRCIHVYANHMLLISH